MSAAMYSHGALCTVCISVECMPCRSTSVSFHSTCVCTLKVKLSPGSTVDKKWFKMELTFDW